ncbi:hypothetical protein [Leisingera sp. M527]|uniref:hypothetical protein n=1 Tax=Leisingera sp. M527 TaxID=2867014 RepID=UPI0021A4647E|nr:hypothetical protein [Leisingera sp. M527]
MVEAAGYPDPGLFLYGDDVIYTLGLRRRGETILFDPELRFEHDCSTFRMTGTGCSARCGKSTTPTATG